MLVLVVAEQLQQAKMDQGLLLTEMVAQAQQLQFQEHQQLMLVVAVVRQMLTILERH